MMADIRPLGTGEYDERFLSQLPWGAFVTSSARVFTQKQKLKIDFNF